MENPPLLIVSDVEKIRIHTNFTNTVQEVHEVTLDAFEQPDSLAQPGAGGQGLNAALVRRAPPRAGNVSRAAPP